MGEQEHGVHCLDCGSATEDRLFWPVGSVVRAFCHACDGMTWQEVVW